MGYDHVIIDETLPKIGYEGPKYKKSKPRSSLSYKPEGLPNKIRSDFQAVVRSS